MRPGGAGARKGRERLILARADTCWDLPPSQAGSRPGTQNLKTQQHMDTHSVLEVHEREARGPACGSESERCS